jgi:twinkle protein
VRQPCGRYDERESEQQVMAEMQGKVLDKDRLPWIELLKKEER